MTTMMITNNSNEPKNIGEKLLEMRFRLLCNVNYHAYGLISWLDHTGNVDKLTFKMAIYNINASQVIFNEFSL